MKWMLVGAAVATAVAACAMAACGDDTTDTSGGAGGSTASTGSPASGSSASSGATGGAGGGPSCEDACGQLYDCGAEMMNCPGFSGDPAEKMDFVTGCVTSCMMQMALIGLVDPKDCAGTVMTISGVSADFKNVCENGFGAGGAGGAGGGM